MADLPGKAILDYYSKKTMSKLFVHDEFGPKVEMPVNIYFRDHSQMPLLERRALQLADGEILDIGAGSGSHSLELQKNKKSVTALEISASACEVMRRRGIKNVLCKDFFKFDEEKYDTLLLLMNGIGLCGTLEGFKNFLVQAKKLLNPNGKIIFDSCDISYMYEDGQFPMHYYGEARCRYEYQKEFTAWFKWLYLDKETMTEIANEQAWEVDIVLEDDKHQYLAVLCENKTIS